MKSATDSFGRLCTIIQRLRAPDGCPWDKEQTPESLRAGLIEEAYECVEAINEKNAPHIREELGDVFLLATMISYMHEQAGTFTVSDVLENISEKLVRRHPHVFADATADSPEEVIRQWNDIKIRVEGRQTNDSVLDGVSRALPPLERAFQLQKKAAKAGFDWLKAEDVWAKVAEELEETREACNDALKIVPDTITPAASAQDRVEEEIGDLLFSVVNISRFLKVDPAIALHRSTGKFCQRFGYVEMHMKTLNKEMNAANFNLMDNLWNEAKKQETGV